MSESEAQAWGQFYRELHKLAENVRRKRLANASTGPSDSDSAQPEKQSGAKLRDGSRRAGGE